MESFKIIDISGSGSSTNRSKKKLSKKQIYKEILSSSDKVQEIINNRKKTKRFDYLNMIPKLNEETSNKEISEPINKTQQEKIDTESRKSSEPIKSSEPKTVSKKERKPKVKRPRTPKVKSQTTLKEPKINDYFKPRDLRLEKAHQSVIDHLRTEARRSVSPIQPPQFASNNFQPITKIKANKENDTNKKVRIKLSPKETRIKQPLRSQPKQFSPVQIKEIIKILVKLDTLRQYSKIHKTIRRLNKIKVNQLLFALRLIKRYSNAPDNMLKNTLFNYITSDIKVQLS